MENIFNNLIIPSHYFMRFYPHISNDLFDYLYDNLKNNILRLDLQDALKNNANGEYIY